MGEQFWRKSYDPGMEDLDPSAWETNYVDAVKPVFERFPNKTAFAFMGVEITFAELDLYSNRFANMLLDSGLKKGDVVGINLPNIPEYAIAWLGTLKAGCVVSGVSPLMASDGMKYQLENSNAKGLVTLDAIFAARVTEIAPYLPDLKLVVAGSVGGFLPPLKRTLGKLLKKIPSGKVTQLPGKKVLKFSQVIQGEQFDSKQPSVALSPDDIAYIQYTGGTTGPPKGAMLSHRNAVSDLLITQKWLSWEHGKGLALSGFPFFHIAGLFFCENCVYLGWTQILIPNPRDTKHICKEIEKYKPTALVNVPSLFQMLLAEPAFKALDFSNLEVCISAAAPFPEESQKELEAVVGRGKLLEVYGMTETSPLSAMNPAKGRKKLGSVGLPLLNTEVRLVDTSTGEEVEQGQPGEICVKGPQVMVGYYNKPEETAKAIDSEGFMHTGDVGIMDEHGYVSIVDRTKDMLIVGGYKVFSVKVEEVLATHPGVDMIAITGKPNPERPGSELVRAYVTLNPDYAKTKNKEAIKKGIMDLAKDKLAPYEAPKEIIIMDEIPLTTVGKIDKKELRKL
ncbi:AMP-dependent CoA ligase/synthetase [Desulfatibacillum aliphaticivorans]|uniref:AMP-dependent CoA ligase/synthetase n=1 Tax=Desulfatibacillum aliphaticivorans TaxID=218208 RepID=B8F993_DESAL|nr:AMP-binding protein [Desulfatibacillum aliphaticivorans]ACL02839.1 AMP-dependent CoA ligase/synthetase [Desulfatibacillum aliphaticivorans]